MVGSTASLVWWWLATPSRCQPWGLNSRGPKTRVTLELHHAMGGHCWWFSWAWRAGNERRWGEELKKMLENRPGTGRGVTWAAASCASQFTLAVRRARGGRAGAHLHELPGGACGCRCSLQACSCSTRDRPPPTHGGLVLALLGSITVSYLQKKKT